MHYCLTLQTVKYTLFRQDEEKFPRLVSINYANYSPFYFNSMYKNRKLLLKVVSVLYILVIIPLLSSSQIAIDYKTIVAKEGSTSEFPTHYAYGTLGPFTGLNRVWVFYVDGEQAVWNTNQISESGEWEEGGTLFELPLARNFTVTFDGLFFHIIRVVDGDLRYQRGRAQINGSILFDPEVIAYSDPIWKVRTISDQETFIAPRHFAVAVDRYNNPWIVVKVSDGNTTDSNFKPIALSSIADDGTWISRPGFPVDLTSSYDWWANGRAPTVVEIDDNNILFTWGNYRSNTSHPDRGFRARLWSDGTLGPIENTGLTWHTAATSVVVPEPGVALVNSQTEVARRNNDGSWTRVDPGDMVNWSNYNSLSAFNNKVRLWDYSNGYIRYRETADNGVTWSQITQKWTASDILHFSASHDGGSQGNHHSLLWSEGSGLYDIVMGIEGEYEGVNLLTAPALVSPVNESTNISINPIFMWDSVDYAETYRIQISRQSDFSDIYIDSSGVIDNYLEVSLEYERAYYWRVNATNQYGTSDWSSVWSFTTIIEAPEKPILVSPLNNETDVPVDVNLVWEASEGAETYHVQVATASDFSIMIIDSSDIASTMLSVSGFNHDKNYYWRVRAGNIGGESDWSAEWNFTTIVEIPAVPSLVTPEDGEINVSVDAMLGWEAADRAESYQVQISEISNFSEMFFDSSGIGNNSLSINSLDSMTTYYWRVRAMNSGGESSWSAIWNFTTVDVTSVDSLVVSIPKNYSISQNYPNPFNPSTTIRYAIPSDSHVHLVIYNILGQVVEELVNEEKKAGTYEVVFNAKDLPSGVYVYRFIAGYYVESHRMLLTK